jgi:hypothetical protein
MGISRFLRSIRTSQSGNVFFALFGAVALVGVVGATSMQVMKGPVRSMSEVTKRTVAENNMIASSKLALLAATTQADDGDCDADGFVEPIPFENAGASPKPTGGGYLPATIGAAINDPWDTRYGYCVWDHGATTAGCGGGNYLTGENSNTGYAIAIISAGPDRTFNTTCSAYPSATALSKTPGSDDVVLGYTYAEAEANSGGLWNLKSGDAETAQINKNLEVKSSGGATTFALDADTGTGDFLILKAGAIRGKVDGDPLSMSSALKFDTAFVETGACSAANTDAFAFDTAGDKLIRCNGANWVAAGGSDNLGNHIATQNVRLGSYWLSGDGGDEGMQVAADGAVSTSGALTTGSTLGVGTNATVGGTLGVTGATTLTTLATSGLGTLNALSVTNNTGVGGTLSVTGGTTLTSLATSGAATLNSLAVTNAATVGTTLGVTGATSLSTLGTSGLATLHSLAVTNNASVGGELDLTGGKIVNLLDPTAAQDAASKAYVDARVAAGTGFVEADPQVSTLNATKWCIANAGGTAIECTENTPAGAADNLGNHIATQNVKFFSAAGGAGLGGGAAMTDLNASNLTTGTVPVARLGSSGTRDNTTFLRGDNTWATISGGADNLGNHTATSNLLMGSNVLDYADALGDKALWYSNTYGTGIESGTLTNWSASTFRWRVGGTDATSGTEKMALNGSVLTLSETGLNFDNAKWIQMKDPGGTYRTILTRWTNDATYLDGGTGGTYFRVANATVNSFALNGTTGAAYFYQAPTFSQGFAHSSGATSVLDGTINFQNTGGSTGFYGSTNFITQPTFNNGIFMASDNKWIQFDGAFSGIKHNNTSTGLLIYSGTSNNNSAGIQLYGKDEPSFGGMAYFNTYDNAGAGNLFAFRAYNGSVWDTKMVIADTGVMSIYGTNNCTIGSGTGATNCTSDGRLKKDIKPIEGALEKVTALNGVTYHWKDKEKDKQEHVGLIAQNVETVFPQAVGEMDGYKTVDYAILVSPLIEAVKELKAQNEALQKRIEDLEAANK